MSDLKRLRELEQENALLQPNLTWSMDFMSDTLRDGRAYRTFNVIDDCARDVLVIAIDFSLTADRVVRELE